VLSHYKALLKAASARSPSRSECFQPACNNRLVGEAGPNASDPCIDGYPEALKHTLRSSPPSILRPTLASGSLRTSCSHHGGGPLAMEGRSG
jgi:hypothetical protein